MSRRRNPEGKPEARKYLLTGIAYCGKCGAPLNGQTKRDRPDKPLRPTYYCRSQGDAHRKHGCGGVTRNAEALDWFITECVLYRLDSPEMEKLLGKTDDGELRALLDDRHLQSLKLDALIDDYATGLLDRDQFKRAKTAAEARLSELDTAIDRAHRELLNIDVPSGQTFRQAWERESVSWRRSIIALLIKRVVVHPGNTKPFIEVNGRRMRFDQNLVDVEWRH